MTERYSCFPTDGKAALTAIKSIGSCCLEIMIWTSLDRVKLNDQKSEVLLCLLPARRDKVPVDCLSVGYNSILFSRVVKTLSTS